MTDLPPQNWRLSKNVAQLLAGAVLVISVLVLFAGWGAGVEALTRLHPDFAAMVPSTALCFLLASLAIVIQFRLPPALKSLTLFICSGIIFAIAFTDLMVIRLTDANGIDAWLWPEADTFNSANMAIATASLFISVAMCLLFLGLSRVKMRYAVVATATIGLIVAVTALVGYYYDASALEEVPLFRGMALHTALAFTALFLAVLMLRPDTGWIAILQGKGGGSRGARNLFPIVVILPLLLCQFALFAAQTDTFSENFRLNIIAIVFVVILSIAVLRHAHIQNTIEGDLRTALADRELLLREVYHRVKNNLQMTISLLRMGMRDINDEQAETLLNSTINRVESLGFVHRMLLSAHVPSEVKLDDFLKDLGAHIVTANSGAHAVPVDLEVTASTRVLHIETAITIGLLVNELVTNSIKHAFEGRTTGTIWIGFEGDADGAATLSVRDDGTGMPQDEDSLTLGTGTLIIRGLVAQLDAKLDYQVQNGTAATIRIPAATMQRMYDA
ncbi:sensor histidine kinase [Parvularcula marina]|uniref:histidine kinase n=1 Tax=Parvularcula marina TaxID=2292771 RepID=A0A371RG05_9PROT|nr:sensor histidine kinase [Parvularcula marina]RFB04372.1 sensor histidine kinase [Parvularcula marina]